ncbi:hypothetical protein [Streptomyces sp. NPDC005494]|uniref:hypothetical protein n=1 Tax=unclassified Streptomyces TaxID=2593676 RepID=UPI0036C5B856
MSQPPPWPPQQPYGARPPAQPPYGQPGTGLGNPHGGQPVADNPYTAQQPPSPQYGTYPPPQAPGTPPQGPGVPPQAPGTFPPGPGMPPQAPRKRRTGLIVGAAAAVALVLIGGAVWFAVGTGDGEDAEAPVAKVSPSAVSPEPGGTDGTEEGGETPDESPSVSAAPSATGTGLQAVWRATDSAMMLALGEEYLDEPARINAILSDGKGLECEGRWQEDESGDFLEVALLCEQDGVRVEDKDRVGNLEQTGNTLSVAWNKGATGTEAYERFRDMETA